MYILKKYITVRGKYILRRLKKYNLIREPFEDKTFKVFLENRFHLYDTKKNIPIFIQPTYRDVRVCVCVRVFA